LNSFKFLTYFNPSTFWAIIDVAVDILFIKMIISSKAGCSNKTN
jgi:hypothetical protein